MCASLFRSVLDARARQEQFHHGLDEIIFMKQGRREMVSGPKRNDFRVEEDFLLLP